MSGIKVLAHVPEAPLHPGDEHTPANQWAFRCLAFYAGPMGLERPGYPHPWIIQVTQVHIKNGDRRFLAFGPMPDAKRIFNIIQVDDVEEFKADPETGKCPGLVADMKFLLTPSYKHNQGSGEAERVEYTHQDLMWHLRDPPTQKRLMTNVDMSANAVCVIAIPFYRNVVAFFVDLGLIAPQSIQIFETKVGSLFDEDGYNVPMVCTVQEWAEFNEVVCLV